MSRHIEYTPGGEVTRDDPFGGGGIHDLPGEDYQPDTEMTEAQQYQYRTWWESQQKRQVREEEAAIQRMKQALRGVKDSEP